MKFDQITPFMKRWKDLDSVCTRGKRYLFKMRNGDLYEAEFQYSANGEPDIDINVCNVHDLSKNPRFEGTKLFGFALSELEEVTPI